MLNRFSPFARVVALVIAGGLLLIAALLWHSQLAGLQVEAQFPADNATSVSGGAAIKIRFSETITLEEQFELNIDPPTAGRIRLEGAWLIFEPAGPLHPSTSYTVTVPAGVSSQSGATLRRPTTWRFQTREARIIYIGWDMEERHQLYSINRDGTDTQMLTAAPYGIFDFAPSTDGSTIAYSSFRADGGTDLWQLSLIDGATTLLLDCAQTVPTTSCSAPVWQPHQQRFIYESRVYPPPSQLQQVALLNWFDVSAKRNAPLFKDNLWPGHAVKFSSDGDWISFVSPSEAGVRVFNLSTRSTLLFESTSGEPAWWSPDGTTLILTNLELHHEGFVTHLFEISLEDGSYQDLSGHQEVEDGPVAWSSAGQLIIGRKPARTSTGKQIWLRNPDGSFESLTDEPFVHHGVFSWSATGTQLLLQRYDIRTPTNRPSIALFDLASNSYVELATNGIYPQWLP